MAIEFCSCGRIAVAGARFSGNCGRRLLPDGSGGEEVIANPGDDAGPDVSKEQEASPLGDLPGDGPHEYSHSGTSAPSAKFLHVATRRKLLKRRGTHHRSSSSAPPWTAKARNVYRTIVGGIVVAAVVIAILGAADGVGQLIHSGNSHPDWTSADLMVRKCSPADATQGYTLLSALRSEYQQAETAWTDAVHTADEKDGSLNGIPNFGQEQAEVDRVLDRAHTAQVPQCTNGALRLLESIIKDDASDHPAQLEYLHRVATHPFDFNVVSRRISSIPFNFNADYHCFLVMQDLERRATGESRDHPESGRPC